MKKSNHNRIIKKVTTAIAFVMVFSIVMTTVSSTVDLIAQARVTQGQIDRLRAEKREYERLKRDVQARIESIEYEHLGEMTKKGVLDHRVELTGLELVNVNETIRQMNLLIREKEYEVVIALNNEEAQLQRYRNRVRNMEENGIVSYFEIIFDSTSFSDLLARIDFIRDIMRADENTYEDLQIARENTITAREALEEIKTELEEEKALLELLELELLEQLEEARALILALEASIADENELLDMYAAEEARAQREIDAAVAALIRQQEEEERLRRLAAQQQGSSGGGGGTTGGGTVTGTGQFMWPMSGSVISRFGVNRGNGRIHLGLDIGAPHGANVVASDSGTVVTTSYNEGGLGYYVVISHGNGISTTYGHLSSYVVNKGDVVSKGQLIGYNGSTGNATTPHLHMEVTVNGTRVDPLPWF